MPKGQDEATRRRRLNRGCCPTHGIGLAQIGVAYRGGKPTGVEVGCPRKDCDFTSDAFPGSEIWDGLHTTSDIERIYDRLPLPIAQVLKDAQAWRAHQRNHRDQSAEDELRNLQQSVDVLDRWETNQDPDYRASDVALVFARAPNPTAPKKGALRLVEDEDE